MANPLDEIEAELYSRGALTPEEAAGYEHKVRKGEGIGQKVHSFWNGVKDLVVGESEDHPELPSLLGMNIENARTPEGKMNMAKRLYPNAEYTEDSLGNPMIIPNSSIMGRDPKAPHYFNRPGISFADWDFVKSQSNKMALPLAASFVTGGVGLIPAAILVGTTGTLSEIMADWEAEKQGANEGMEWGTDVKEGAMYAIGEAGGRGLSKVAQMGAPIAAKYFTKATNAFRKLTGKSNVSARRIFNEDGSLTDFAKQALNEYGVTADDVHRLAEKDFKNWVDDAVKPRAAEYYQAKLAQAVEKQKASGQSMDEITKTLEDMHKWGIDLRQGTITKNFDQEGFEQIMLKSKGEAGDIMRKSELTINDQFNDALHTLRATLKGEKDPSNTGGFIMNTLRDMKAAKAKARSMAYEANKGSGKVVDDVDNIFYAIEDAMDQAGNHSAIKFMYSKFKEYGIGLSAKQKQMLAKAKKAPKVLDVDELERLRKIANAQWEGANPTEKLFLGRIKSAIDETMAMTDDTAYKGYLNARNMHIELADDYSQADIIKRLIDKKSKDIDAIPQNIAVQKIVFDKSNNVVNLNRLYDVLVKKGGREGVQRWRDLQTSTITELMDRSISKSNIEGTFMLSPDKFVSNIDRIGDAALKKLYGKHYPELMSLKRLMQKRIPQQGTFNSSDSFTLLRNFLSNFSSTFPGKRMLIGNMERAVEKHVKSAAAEVAAKEATKPLETMLKSAAKIEKSKRILPKVGVGLAGIQQEE